MIIAVTNAATWATAGEVLTYAGAPIDAVYEADSGGYTADSADVWWSALPYLAAVPEPKGYVSPNRWQITRSATALGAAAAAAGTPTGAVAYLAIVAREVASGRVIGLLLGGPKGWAELRDDAVRTGLGLPSNLFVVRTPTEVTVLGAQGRRRLLGLDAASAEGAGGQAALAPAQRVAIEAANAERTLAAAPPSYVFVGRGDGPGLGMSQDGALFMARHGATASAILLYYYRGVTVTADDGEGSS